MALCKTCITILGTLVAQVVGGYYHNNFETFGFGPINVHQPWSIADYSPISPFKSEPSHFIPQFADSPAYGTIKHATDPVPSFSSDFKKIPKADKPLQKILPSLHSPTVTDDPKLKEATLKTETPHCEEIPVKDSKTDAKISGTDHKKMTCYRCKDPEHGSNYEHCSYTSQPESKPRKVISNAATKKTVDSLPAAAASHPKSSRKRGPSKLPESYLFSDDYFHPEASDDLPTRHEKNNDSCERIVRDSMICMVCKDPKTNGKYEQCSYVSQPNERTHSYTKSSSFGGAKPKTRELILKEALKEKDKGKDKKIKKTSKLQKEREEVEEEEEQEAQEREPEANHHYYNQEEPEELSDYAGDDESGSSEDKEAHDSHAEYVPDYSYHHPTYKDYKGSYGTYGSGSDEEDATAKQSVKSKANCKTIYKDGQSCSVCTNPKTGGKSERCDYAYEPKDKVYKYTKSKSFGSPQSQQSGKHQKENDRDKSSDSSEKQENDGSGEDYSSYSGEPYIHSESEKVSEKVRSEGNCREEKRDSEICTICKDPKTGGDSEQCSYSYDPEDKVYAYSKSNSFGTPTKLGEDDSHNSRSSGSEEEHPEETYSFPVIYPTGTSPLDYIPKPSASQLSSVYTTKKPKDKKLVSTVDHGFYDAKVRRAEIEKMVKDIGQEDKSKCKKVARGDMTCYRCADGKGFTNEECVFVADPEQATGASASVTEVTAKPTPGTTTSTTTSKLDPLESTSWTSVITKRKTRETRGEASGERDDAPVLDEERDEVEPYDSVAETRPVYSKVLKMTLPAYMVERSPSEIEFDEFVENSKF